MGLSYQLRKGYVVTNGAKLSVEGERCPLIISHGEEATNTRNVGEEDKRNLLQLRPPFI